MLLICDVGVDSIYLICHIMPSAKNKNGNEDEEEY